MVNLKTITSRSLLSAIPLAKLPSLPRPATNSTTSSSPALAGINVLATGSCDIGQVECGLGCMPIASVCCGVTGYCDIGEYCTVRDTCCPVGKVCSPGGGCDPGESLCNGGCMPSTGVCCSDGGYCDAGETCTDEGTCASGGSSGGSGGGGSSGGSGSGGSGTRTCLASDGKEVCDDRCMDLGAVCCGDGDGSYCDAGYYCTPTGCCRDGRVCRPGSANGGGSGSGGSDDDSTSSSDTSTTPPTPTTGPTTSAEASGDGGAKQGLPGVTPSTSSSDNPIATARPAGDGNGNGNDNGNGGNGVNNNGPGNNNFSPPSGADRFTLSAGCVFAAGIAGVAAFFL